MFAFVWMALLPLCLMSAFVGVLLWVWVALLSPNELLSGFLAGVPFNKIVAVVSLILLVVNREKKQPYLDGAFLALLLLAVVSTISWSNALAPSEVGDQLYQKLMKEIVLAFTIAAVMTTRDRIHMLVLTVVVALGFTAVKEGVISLLTGGGHKILGSGSIGDNNALATALLMTIPLMFYLARYSAVRAVRIGLFVTIGLSLVTVVMTFSRGGFIGLVVLGGFVVKNSRRKAASIALIVVVAGLIYALAPASLFSRLNTIQDANNDGSFMGRVVAWKMSWLIATAHPLFGGGPHAVQHVSVWATFKPYLPSVDFVTTPPAPDIPIAAHSIYFETLGDMGFSGLFLFLTMIGVSFWNCRWIVRRARGVPSLAWAADLARMSQISLVVYMITGAALSMAYFELVYVFVAMLSRSKRLVKHTIAEEKATASRDMDLSFGYATSAAQF